ncbi:MAG: hypothetical protein ACE5I1_06275 [bacterium]
MIDMKQLNAQYITTESGKKMAVILPIDVFQSLLEDLEDLAVRAERKDEPSISHEELVREFKNDGII